MSGGYFLPVAASEKSHGVRELGARSLLVSAPGFESTVAAANELVSKAYDVSLVLTGGSEADGFEPDVEATFVGEAGAPGEPGSDWAVPAQGRDPRPAGRSGQSEAYEFSNDGSLVTISHRGAESLFRALISLAGAVDAAGGDLPLLHAQDAPRYAWRGLSFDVVRHWFPRDEVEKVIDLLALLKFNVLHLHLSDTQAWRFDVPGYPELTAKDPHFSGEDLSALAKYAADRHITIIPEADLPGHTAAVRAALPDLAPGEYAHDMGVFLDWETPGVPAFITAVVTELSHRFDSPHYHIGGDEAFGMPHDRYLATVKEVVSVVRSAGRIPMGWQEVCRAGALGPDDLVQLWIADRDRFDAEKMKQQVPQEYHALVEQAGKLFALAIDDPETAVAAGVPLLDSASDPLYLDRRPAEASSDPEQNAAGQRLGHPGYEKTASLSILEWDPTTQRDLVETQGTVAGIEAALWCESVESFEDATALLLPRLALVAQKAWGPLSHSKEDVLTAVRAQTPAWERLGFHNYYRSVEVYASE